MKLATITVLSLLIGLSTRSMAAPPLEEILARLEQVDRDIRIVKTEGTTREYEWDETTSSWKTTPMNSSFQCIIENKPKGRYVLTENPSIMRWEKGMAPYLAEWSVQFRDSDGFVTHWEKAEQYHNGTQLMDAPIDLHEAQRSKTGFWAVMAQRAETMCSGLGFTALKVMQRAPVYHPERAKDFTVSDTPDGMVHVRGGVPEACIAYDYLLDPRKNLALVRFTYSQNRAVTATDGEFVEMYEVLEHRQIAAGIWYPVHCAITRKHSKEFADLMRARGRPEKDQDQTDHYAATKSELVLSKVALLNEKDAVPDLTVKLPDGLDITNEK